MGLSTKSGDPSLAIGKPSSHTRNYLILKDLLLFCAIAPQDCRPNNPICGPTSFLARYCLDTLTRQTMQQLRPAPAFSDPHVSRLRHPLLRLNSYTNRQPISQAWSATLSLAHDMSG